jgi:hypothetical protein
VTRILCDFDGAIPCDFWTRVEMVAKVHRFAIVGASVERSGSGKGWHVVVIVRERVAIMRVVALQAILGSDWKRELFNSRRAAAWRRVPGFWRKRANVLYSRHYKG